VDILTNLAMGFGFALSPENLAFALIGAFLGTLLGAMPGIGPSTALALLLPVTFGMNPSTALVMLVAVYSGVMFGGRIPAILINTPGDSNAVATTFDGYPLMQQGKGAQAMGISAVSSFMGGIMAVVVLTVAAPYIARVATRFGPPEIFALVIFGLSTVVGLAGRSIWKGLAMAFLGGLLGMIGPEIAAGEIRFAPFREIRSGLNFVAVVIGLFGIAEVLVRLENSARIKHQSSDLKLLDMIPSLSDMRRYSGAMLRAFGIGTLVGVLPGAGGTLGSFLAYSAERSVSREPERFGKGAMEGVVASETSDNASANASLIPLMSLGIPGSGGTAILLGALVMYGLQPGPLLFMRSPDVAWTVIASLYISMTMLLITNIVAIPLLMRLVYASDGFLNGVIIAFCFVGAYTLNFQTFEIWQMIVFGILGYAMRKFGYPAAPLILALVLAPIGENAIGRSLMLSQGDIGFFLQRPVAMVFLVLAALVVLVPAARSTWRTYKRYAAQ
jgi:putative tricarboxylic transport membrane protein